MTLVSAIVNSLRNIQREWPITICVHTCKIMPLNQNYTAQIPIELLLLRAVWMGNFGKKVRCFRDRISFRFAWFQKKSKLLRSSSGTHKSNRARIPKGSKDRSSLINGLMSSAYDTDRKRGLMYNLSDANTHNKNVERS